jgi:hypothetical protein
MIAYTGLNPSFTEIHALVEEVVDRTPPDTLRKLYKIPEYNSTLEFLTMLALTNGRLLKVPISWCT